jgi:hypothetical protein
LKAKDVLSYINHKENKLLISYIMRTNTVRYWKDKREKLLKKYDNLTYRDLRFNVGEEKAMIEGLGSKLGKSMKELLSIIITL